MKKKTPRRPQDLTLRNLRALRTDLGALANRVAVLEDALVTSARARVEHERQTRDHLARLEDARRALADAP